MVKKIIISMLLLMSFFQTINVCAQNSQLSLHVLFVAEPYGFGPAAAVERMATSLRPYVSKLSFAGTGHSLDLQKSVGFDEIHNVASESSEFDRILKHVDVVISSTDFTAIKKARMLGVKTVLFDDLFWYWDQIPEESYKADLVLLQNFFGVERRLKEEVLSHAKIITPLGSKKNNSEKKSLRNKQVILSLGGLFNPTVQDELFSPYAKSIYQGLHKGLDENLFLCANSKIEKMTKLGFVQTSAANFSEEIKASKAAVLTPGLGHILDAYSSQTPVLWLPAANPSQGRQLELLRKEKMVPYHIDWHQIIPDIEPIDYFDAIEQVQVKINSNLKRLEKETLLQQNLSMLISQSLKKMIKEQKTPLKLNFHQDHKTFLSEIYKYLSSIKNEKNLIELHVGAGQSVLMSADKNFNFTQRDLFYLKSHLPNFSYSFVENLKLEDKVLINQSYQEQSSVSVDKNEKINLSTESNNLLPDDFIHALYGLSRKRWLNKGVFPVHAACVGSDEGGYTLIIGPSGAGKTSTVLKSTLRGAKVFSGDKTLVEVDDKGDMYAVNGTKNLTIRNTDIWRWKDINLAKSTDLGSRLSVELAPELYSNKKRVKIKKIIKIKVDEHKYKQENISALSALHQLYPLFMDSEREDILINAGESFVDGSVSASQKQLLANKLSLALKKIPVEDIVGSLEQILQRINPSERLMFTGVHKQLKILFGICGIGNGHISRQAPLVRYFLERGDQVMIFAYGASLEYFYKLQSKYPKLIVLEVKNTYIPGNSKGLDFLSATKHKANEKSGLEENAIALNQAKNIFGNANLVISDYEEISARFAYLSNAPLVTLDQQSKYLNDEFTNNLEGFSSRDEIERLLMFFPVAKKRFAQSFFKIEKQVERREVELIGPAIRPEIAKLKELSAQQNKDKNITVYYSSQNIDEKKLHEDCKVYEEFKNVNFYIYIPSVIEKPRNFSKHIHFYFHRSEKYLDHLGSSMGVIATAGHNLLSECMFLKKPVLAMPLKLYEQQMNAHVIEKNGFGLKAEKLDQNILKKFIENIDGFKENIENDHLMLIPALDYKVFIEHLLEYAK